MAMLAWMSLPERMSAFMARMEPRLKGRMADTLRVPVLSAIISVAGMSGRERRVRRSWRWRLYPAVMVGCWDGSSGMGEGREVELDGRRRWRGGKATVEIMGAVHGPVRLVW